MTEPVRILHVDDMLDFAEMTATFLERKNDQFSVETARSADEGLAYLAESRVDCVVSASPRRSSIARWWATDTRMPPVTCVSNSG